MDSIYFPLFRGKALVYGGPYRNKPDYMFGVKMAVEIQKPCDVSIPTKDFQVPSVFAVDEGLIDTLQAIRAGKDVYVGCMGGIGRTGLFLAIIAKAMGIKDPVAYVRAHYYAHAVETDEQKQYVADYKVQWAARMEVLKLKLTSLVKAY